MTDEIELGNPLGGRDIPAEQRVQVIDWNVKSQRALIRREVSADPQAARAAILEGLQRIARQSGLPAPNAADFPAGGLSIHSLLDYTVDVERGWVTRLEGTKTARIGDLDQRETVRIGERAVR